MSTNNQTPPDYSSIDTTTTIYNTALSAVNNTAGIAQLSFSGQEKAIIKYATRGQAAIVSLLVSFTQEGDKVKAVATTASGIVVGEVTGLTIGATLTYLAAGIVATASAPVAIGIGVGIALTSAVVGTVVAVESSDTISQLYDYGKAMWDDFFGKSQDARVERLTDNTSITATDFNQALNDMNYIVSKESKVELFGDSILREYLQIDSTNNTATVSANTQETETAIINDVLNSKTDFVNKITHDNQTFDIKNLSTIELRNAVIHIDKVSFLLSNILIKTGEQLDLGSQGIYTVKSGEAFSPDFVTF